MSGVVSDLLDQVATQSEEIAMLRAKAAPPRPVRLLGPACVRMRDSTIWVLDNHREGWADFGFPCASWDEVFRRFDVVVTSSDHDVWGDYWIVDNAPVDEQAVAAIRATPAFR
jgi:hypothetical protein